jgi:hypothetical protein
MSDKIKSWKERKPRQEKKDKRSFRIGNEKLAPLRDMIEEDSYYDYQDEEEIPR